MSKLRQKPDGENVRTDLTSYHKVLWDRFSTYAKEQHDLVLPQNVRLSPGFTTHGKSAKSKLQVEVLFPEATMDGNYEIVVRWAEGFDGRFLDDIAAVVPQILNGKPDRDSKCRDLAIRWGLDVGDGGLRAARPGRRLREFLSKLDDELGPYPHLGVRFDVLNTKRTKVMIGGSAPQKGRMHKVQCDKCGLIVRQSQKAIDDCGIAHCSRHGEMTVHYKEGDEPDQQPAETSEEPAADATYHLIPAE